MEDLINFTEQDHINLTSAGSDVITKSIFRYIPENQFITIDGEFQENMILKLTQNELNPEFEIF